jgi:hypothetical protein
MRIEYEITDIYKITSSKEEKTNPHRESIQVINQTP